MPVLQAILDRRSIRVYQEGAPVSDEQVHELLEAAMAAPSAHGGRPWAFVVVRERRYLDALRRVHPYADMLSTATLAIVICVAVEVKDAITAGFVQQGCAAAAENIMLQATASGLGTCWCGGYPIEAIGASIRDALALPEHLVPFNIIAVGVPAEAPERRGMYEQSKVLER